MAVKFKFHNPVLEPMRFRTQAQLQGESHGALKDWDGGKVCVDIERTTDAEYKIVVAWHEARSTMSDIRLSPHSFIDHKKPKGRGKAVLPLVVDSVKFMKNVSHYVFDKYALCKATKKTVTVPHLREKYEKYYEACNQPMEKTTEDIEKELQEADMNLVRLGFTLLERQANGLYVTKAGPLLSDRLENTEKTFAVHLNCNPSIGAVAGETVALVMKSKLPPKSFALSIGPLNGEPGDMVPLVESREKSNVPGTYTVLHQCVIVIVTPVLPVTGSFAEYRINLRRNSDGFEHFVNITVHNAMPMELDEMAPQGEQPQPMQPPGIHFDANDPQRPAVGGKHPTAEAIEALAAKLKALRPFDSPHSALMYYKKHDQAYSARRRADTTLGHDAIASGHFTKLHMLAVGGHAPHLAEYMRHCTNAAGNRLLHAACLLDQPDLVRPLVGMRCPLDACNLQHDSPLHVALRGGHGRCVASFVDLIKDIGTPLGYDHVAGELERLWRLRNAAGQGVQHLAVRHGYDELVLAMLGYCRRRGKDGMGVAELCLLQEYGQGNTIAHIAVGVGNERLARQICDLVPSASGAMNYAGRTCWEISEDEDDDQDDDEDDQDDDEDDDYVSL